MDTLSSLSERQQKLLRHLLENSGGLTLDQLAERLGISRNAVAQHIFVLEKIKCVQSNMLPSAGGRPSRAYVITENGLSLFPKQYGLFSRMLLKAVSENMEDKALTNMLTSIGHDLAATYKDRVDKSIDAIEEVRIIMEELGYETEGVIPEDKSEIKAKNCVFHDLAYENKAVCQLDIALISTLLKAKVEQKACMADGDDSCRFCIKDK